MARWEDVRTLALGLPGTVEDVGSRTTCWLVSGKPYAWERILTPAERAAVADPPEGPALGLRTADPGLVDVLVASRPELFFTVAGYGVHPMVLLRVHAASYEDLDEALTEAWLARASKRLRSEFLDGTGH